MVLLLRLNANVANFASVHLFFSPKVLHLSDKMWVEESKSCTAAGNLWQGYGPVWSAALLDFSLMEGVHPLPSFPLRMWSWEAGFKSAKLRIQDAVHIMPQFWKKKRSTIYAFFPFFCFSSICSVLSHFLKLPFHVIYFSHNYPL